MGTVSPGYYVIFSKQGSNTCIGLDSSNNLCLQTFDATKSATTWLVEPAAGSDGFYLQHEDTGYCPHFGQDGSMPCASLDPNNTEYVIMADDVGDGYVAINNHDRSRVFDAKGAKNSVGTAIIPFRWNGNDNQKWRFTPTAALNTP